MKKILLLSAAALSISFPAMAEETAASSPYGSFSTTVGFVSEYSFRGLSQSDEGPAIQGSIDWAHDSGFYAGVWGSNVDFNDGDEAQMEADLYAGYKGEIEGFTYDVGAIYYAYPGADEDKDYDFYEGKIIVGYDFDVLALWAGGYFSPDYFADSGHAEYYTAGIDVPLTFLPWSYETKLSGSVGHQSIDKNAKFGFKDYSDYGVGVSANVEGFNLGLRYIDTSLSETNECADGCEERVIASVTKTFP